MTVAQGTYKKLSYKKQTALGAAASGAGGQYLRRETSTWALAKDTFNANEILTHMQDTGISYGIQKVTGSLSGVVSPATYKDFLASLLRKDFVATTAIASVSLTIAGTGPYTITRAAGDFLADGVKIGDVVRITAGTYTGTARDINLLVTTLTATVLTVIVVNGSSLSAQGPITSSTLTIMGKKTWVPTTGHTNDYYTFEEWFNDLTRSRTYTDVQCASADIGLPSTGNATVGLSFLGLGRTKGASQVLTSPTVETSTAILSAVNGYVLVNGTRVQVATSMSVKIDGQMQHGEAVIGSKTISDITKGDVKVTGSFSAQFDAETISDLFVNETAISIVMVVTADATATSDFITLVIPRVKITKDDVDDGKKQLVASYDFVAEYNASGGAALANNQTICSIQDSAA
jgi:Phage tail tube protein